MSAIPMVKVKANSERGWRWINASDFDPSTQKFFGAEQAAEVSPEPAEPESIEPEPASEQAPAVSPESTPKRGPGRPKRSQ